jgi:cytochrome c biogenesis protein CcmG, thiol:disulfide interchange protein DsbE
MNPTLRKLLIPAVVAVLFVGLIASLLRPAEPGNTSTALLEGKTAPTFTLVNLNGGTVSLESYKGKPIVLNFFASWCVPCKDEAPMLSQAAQDFGDRVVFLGVAYNDKADKAKAFGADYNLNFPLALDDDGDTGRASVNYALFGVPETFFIDKDGIVRKHYPKPITRDELEAGLKLIEVI